MNEEELMAEGYKKMNKETIQFLEGVYKVTIKLPKLTDEEILKAIWESEYQVCDWERFKVGGLKEYERVIAQAQIDLIKEANPNVEWEE